VWDAQNRCVVCRKPKGVRGWKPGTPAQAPAQKPAPAQAPAPTPAPAQAAGQVDELAARRAKLQARFAPAAAAEATAEAPAAAEASETSPEAAEEKMVVGDLAEIFGPLIPEIVIAGEKKLIERGGHIPNEPNAELQERFQAACLLYLRKTLPKVEMSAGKSTLAYAAGLYISMRVGAEKIKAPDAPAKLAAIKADASAIEPATTIQPSASASTLTANPEEPLEDGDAPNAHEQSSDE
jgi:hypothetical protein